MTDKVICNKRGSHPECMNCGASRPHYKTSCEQCPFFSDAKCVPAMTDKEKAAREYAMKECEYFFPDCTPENCNDKCQWYRGFLRYPLRATYRSFLAGYNHRQPEIDALRKEIERLKDPLKHIDNENTTSHAE